MGRSLLGGLAALVLTSALIQTGGACSTTVLDFHSDGGVGGTAGAGGNGLLAHAPQVCGGEMCPDGQLCCYATLTCFDPSQGAHACGYADGGMPPTFPGDDVCWSDLDCGAGEFCYANACAGLGNCTVPEGRNCGSSSSPQTQCGCDGKNYPSREAACAAGVRVAGARACGEAGLKWSGDPGPHTVCATDANCPDGFHCCGYTGHCFDETMADACLPPPGSLPGSPCAKDDDCQGGFCYQTSCGGPGVCTRGGRPGCDSSVNSPVCGCNGLSYRNSDCALYHDQIVAHDGPC